MLTLSPSISNVILDKVLFITLCSFSPKKKVSPSFKDKINLWDKDQVSFIPQRYEKIINYLPCPWYFFDDFSLGPNLFLDLPDLLLPNVTFSDEVDFDFVAIVLNLIINML